MAIDKQFAFKSAYAALNITATLKQRVEDFVVDEEISIDFSGDGEHCWVQIKKQGCNTDWLAQQIAEFCDVKRMAVSFAGLKDRHAVTTQWFSVQLPGKETPDWEAFEKFFNKKSESIDDAASVEKIQVLANYRHSKKLQRGALKGNRFSIRLRDLSDCTAQAFNALQNRCEEIASQGVPNYFGPQRFGRDYANLDQALKYFARPRQRLSKAKRSLYLSAARSWLFNHMLSERIAQGKWAERLVGDVFMLDGKSACFKDDGNAELETRLMTAAIHPTACLWGEGDLMVEQDAYLLEKEVIDRFPEFRDGLIKARLQAQRRSCRVIPQGVTCKRQGDDFVVDFSLPAGCYATVVLSEIFSDLTTRG